MASPAAPAPERPSEDRTFLFTDIEGSTARWEAQREAMAAALPRHDALLRGAIEGWGGQVFKTVGDAFCAVFADVASALGAALEAQRALAVEDWNAFGAAAAAGIPEGPAAAAAGSFAELRVRMGIHRGRAEARGGDYFGPALNHTARLMAAGHGGQILLGRAAREDLGPGGLPAGCRLRDLGEHRLKDLRQSEQLYQVLAEDLPDIAKAPRTAGELGARDRIAVADLEEAGADRSWTAAGLVLNRTVDETFAALLAVVRGDVRSLVLTVPQMLAAAQHRPADLAQYRLGRIAAWSQPRYRLDGRFVALSLLVDQGEEASGGRWATKEETYSDLGALIAATPDPALVLLGPPGAGKSTLLRRLELDLAIAALRGEDPLDRVSFFLSLNQYKAAEPGQAPPAPERWLAERWAAAHPQLPALDQLLAQGRMLLLLDALNEMPAGTEREFRERVGLWKGWLQRLATEAPRNRVLFSCRSLDYAAPLSTPALRVPQVQIEPLTDAQVEAFLSAYSPVRGSEIWAALRGTAQLEALRSPYFLALLVDQVEATGDLPRDRAGLFTGFVRQALRREVERDNPLFAPEDLLSSRDLRRIVQWQWQDAHELPERGPLFGKLAQLAYRMQASSGDGGASQLRLDLDRALDLLDSPRDEAIVKAGLALAVLDEDPAADELLYRHQLLQEFFAARVLARSPQPELVVQPWRSAEIRPTVPELLATLPPAESLPPLPQTGWEETTLLAALMAPDPEEFLRGLMVESLTLAGRAAGQAALLPRLGEGLLTELREALLARSRDDTADLRERIAGAEALGRLGDPRWERCHGTRGSYLRPPLVSVAGARYPIGEDAAIDWEQRGGRIRTEAHVPRHAVTLAAFAIGRYPVTNAEFGCFVAAGAYEDESWWDTEDARRWWRGELANEGAKENNRYWWRAFRADTTLFPRMVAEGGFASDEVRERWERLLGLDEAAFEAELEQRWRGRPEREPLLWRDPRFIQPNQPVVGVSWYEARAYCAWLAAQSGEAFRLPSEVEWEAAARGSAGRSYPWGQDFDVQRANTSALRLRRPTPVGLLPAGDSPEGICDLSGNVDEWTQSLWGVPDTGSATPTFGYPYRAADGREDAAAPSSVARVVRGGCWDNGPQFARACYRNWNLPYVRTSFIGFRLCLATPDP